MRFGGLPMHQDDSVVMSAHMNMFRPVAVPQAARATQAAATVIATPIASSAAASSPIRSPSPLRSPERSKDAPRSASPSGPAFSSYVTMTPELAKRIAQAGIRSPIKDPVPGFVEVSPGRVLSPETVLARPANPFLQAASAKGF